jgi:trans-2,3-dihydro-3-hydroxyanthranilate isomerase
MTAGEPARRRLSWLDVFTDRPFAGNQLAVIPDGDGLSDEQMQALARELAISETVFVVDDGRRLRIWTPGYELPGAGHPVVGAALELARLGRIPAEGNWVFRTGPRETPVELADGMATMNQGEPALGIEHDTTAVAAALQIEESALVSLPQHCSTGVRQVFAQVADREALTALQPDLELVRGLERADGLVAWCEVDDGEVAQRFFAPQMGIAEDPATGSASGPLGCYLLQHKVVSPEAARTMLSLQGVAMKRPSRIHISIAAEGDRITKVRVGGQSVLVGRGEVTF